MEELTYEAKIAVVKILKEIMHADNRVHAKEAGYLESVVQTFALSEDYASEVEQLMTLKALSTIRGLTTEQKREIARMMGTMIVVDKDINYNEVKLYNAFCESCDIERDFNTEDYPECTLSGPFVNPEDLMNN
jgi:uncharacterized tellurite resistance protein B-like protein